MKKGICIALLATVILSSFLLSGCGENTVAANSLPDETTEAIVDMPSDGAGVLSEEVTDALGNLNSVQINYAQGTAPLNIIPDVMVKTVYDNWDDIVRIGDESAPISLREYVDPEVVYFDYDTDYSIKWEKATGNVTVEQTDINAREDYKQKMHK